MKLKVTLQDGGGRSRDLRVTVNSLATVGDLASALAERDPAREAAADGPSWTLRLHGTGATSAAGTVLSAEDLVVDSRLRSGAVLSLAPRSSGFVDGRAARGPTAAVLTVVEGPQAGTRFELPVGVSYIGRGRDCDVRLDDPLVSKRHARVNVTGTVEVVDARSANGVLLGGSVVERAVLRSGDVATVGDTSFTVTRVAGEQSTGEGGGVDVLRSPRVVTRLAPEELTLPDVPGRPARHRFPILAMIAPLVVGAGLFAVTRSPLSLIFILLSPVMMLGSWWDQRRQSQQAQRDELAEFEENLENLRERLAERRQLERSIRMVENPAAAEVVEACRTMAPLLWTRRPDLPGFLQARIGLGSRPSRTTVRDTGDVRGRRDLLARARAVATDSAVIDGVPVVADLARDGAVGVAGPAPAADAVGRSLLLQLVGLHSPAELVVTCAAGAQVASDWEWIGWLPHASSLHSPLTAPSLVSSPGDVLALVTQLEELVGSRAPESSRDDGAYPQELLPAVVLLVVGNVQVDRHRLVQLVEHGPAAGVHVVWLAASVDQLPAGCHVHVDVTSGTDGSSAGDVRAGETVTPLVCDRVETATALELARALAPLVDVGARVEDQTDLPRSVAVTQLLGEELLDEPLAVVERWRQSDSLNVRDGSRPRRRKHESTLRTVVGQAGQQPLTLDLKVQGPHALVGGTTGSGKSEFLQAWVLGMALAYSPDRVTFLLVDYKGGAAFKDCKDLPHCVGLVTDLSPAMVRRALTSLKAELHHREELLGLKRVKDIEELERSGDPDCPPSLVIVVDEFAALAVDVPQFVDGVVDVAARGRSLGLHLVLATQRPAGVIRDSLRANTNLRVALRMNDEDDSTDVLGLPLAASFDPGLPGRAAVRTGPSRVVTFQSAYAGGRSLGEAPAPEVEIETLGFGAGLEWPVREDQDVDRSLAEPGPDDISRMVSTVRAAAESAAVPEPRKPWQPELAALHDANLLNQRTDEAVLLGVQDRPDRQTQEAAYFRPDVDANMAVFGTGGSGKSTLLRSLAVSSGISPRGGPVQIYALDFSSGGLAMLEGLPHVGAVIGGEDHERISRLLRMLKDVVEERGARYAATRAATVSEYRTMAGAPRESRILLLVDGLATFRQEYEFGPRAPLFQLFQQLASDGRAAGLHVVVTADRPGTVPPSLAATIQRRVVLRLASEDDYALLGVESDVLRNDSPPGRGVVDGTELQVAVWGASGVVAEQARAVEDIAVLLRRRGVPEAPPVQRLAERVAVSSLPAQPGRVVIGLADDTLGPYSLAAEGTFLVAGPPASGRTTALAAIASAALRSNPGMRTYYLGQKKSPLLSQPWWTSSASGADEVDELAQKLAVDLAGSSDTPVMIVIEGIADFLAGRAEMSLQSLVQLCREQNHLVVADGETTSLMQSWQLVQLVRAGRRGIALQPDQTDGDSIFRTTFPRVSRAEFPVGRGLLVDGGRVVRVQMAIPE